ncbi:MAG: hypothetical protein ACJ75B_15470 [Flavisolibacter sp.]
MRNNKWILVFFIFSSSFVHAQDDDMGLYKKKERFFSLYLSAGPGYFASSKGAPDYLQPEVSKWQPFYNVRIMWHPSHRVSMGIETGFITFYSYNFKDSLGKKGKLSFQSIPILVEYSFPLTKRLSIYAGSGIYLLYTELDYGGHSKAQKISPGWVAAASYSVPLTKRSQIAVETKWLYASETSNGSICLQLQYVWKFLKW